MRVPGVKVSGRCRLYRILSGIESRIYGKEAQRGNREDGDDMTEKEKHLEISGGLKKHKVQHRDVDHRSRSLLEVYTGTDLPHHPALPPRIDLHLAQRCRCQRPGGTAAHCNIREPPFRRKAVLNIKRPS